jgi:hypothetical protein
MRALIAEGVREPHEGYRDLSWIDRIAASLRPVVRGLCVTNLGQRDLVAAEVRERQLPAALGFSPDLAIVAAAATTLCAARSRRRGWRRSSTGSSARCAAGARTS